MKTIKIIRITTKEVPDDYVLSAADVGDTHVQVECDGDMHLQYQEGRTFGFIDLDDRLENIQPTRSFLFWANVAWVGFYRHPDMPEKLTKFVDWFREVNGKGPSRWALDYLRQKSDRIVEIKTHQVDFTKWDEQIFSPDEYWFSRN